MFHYFIEYPYLTLIPIAVFFLLYRKGWPRIILGGSIVWAVYGLHELSSFFYCRAHAPCIRIDMFVVPPLLSGLSALFLILGFLGRCRSHTPR